MVLEDKQAHLHNLSSGDENICNEVSSFVECRICAPNNGIYLRRFQENDGQFPATSYNEFCRFYAQVARADAARAVMVKSQ